VTERGDDDITMLGATRAEALDDAIARALADLAADGRPEPTCYLMPSAACTVPFLKN
jgi:hypothetical protein